MRAFSVDISQLDYLFIMQNQRIDSTHGEVKMNEAILAFVNKKMSTGQSLAQAVHEAEIEFNLSQTLVYLSIIQAERRLM